MADFEGLLEGFKGKKTNSERSKDGVVKDIRLNNPSNEEKNRHMKEMSKQVEKIALQMAESQEGFILSATVKKLPGEEDEEDMSFLGGGSIGFMVKALMALTQKSKEFRQIMRICAALMAVMPKEDDDHDIDVEKLIGD